MMNSLFDSLTTDEDSWRPEPLPSLSGVDKIYLDYETDGLRWWDGDKPVGFALKLPGERSKYFPISHHGYAHNIPLETVQRWQRAELPGKRIHNQNVKFEVHMSNAIGVDWEPMGITLGDPSHWVALLDDHRQEFNLDSIAHDYLGRGKIQGLDKKRMKYLPPGRVAPYACVDVDLVEELETVLWPRLTEESLHNVRQLEEDVIWVVCEMERNGLVFDTERLDSWIKQSEREIRDLTLDIFHDTGVKVNPADHKSKTALFNVLRLPITEMTATGKPSFTDAVLKRIDHPIIAKLRRMQRVASLKSKYLDNGKARLSPGGIMRFGLHQLRTERNEDDGQRSVGTVSGRFSSTGIVEGEGQNAQQFIKVAKQRTTFGYDEDDDSHDEELYVIRKLITAGPGMQLVSSDMMQVEYRYFAHLAKNPVVIAAFAKTPFMSFHKFIWGIIREFAPLTYRQQKDLNFAIIYAAGLAKMAAMLGFITASQLAELRAMDPLKVRNHPWLEEARKVRAIYDRELPEVKPLLKMASGLAESRGYVKTIDGRRSRFPDGQRLHKALNGVIQGSCADINKRKLVQVYKSRKELGLIMRLTLHDELLTDVPDREQALRLHDLLNIQQYDLRVPVLWETAIGPNWAECENLPHGDYTARHYYQPSQPA